VEEQVAINNDNNTNNSNLLHGTQVLKELVLPWANSGRVVCADSYFSSVGAAIEMTRIGLCFIGVVKTATRGYPMTYLSQIELQNCGDYEGIVTTFEGSDILAFVWMDRTRRYFILTAGSLGRGTPYTRERWRQVTPDGEPELVEFTIPQPKAAEIYYNCCASIDRHNRCRQDDLMLEKKFGTHDWSKQVNISLLGICIVDSWLVFKGCRGGVNCETPQQDFYTDLAEELIDNAFDGRRIRGRHMAPENDLTVAASGIGPHLTPTNRKRKKQDGTTTSYTLQGRCIECNTNGTIHVCSECRDLGSDPNKEFFLCNTRKNSTCFQNHLTKVHNL